MSAPDLSGVRAIFFDLDDTLCAYWSASHQALHESFQEEAPEGVDPEKLRHHWKAAFHEVLPLISDDDWYRDYLKSGERTRTETMHRALQRSGIDDMLLAARISETYRNRRNVHLELFPDALAVLDALKGRYPLGLITNGPADIQRMEIDTLCIEPYFDPIFIEGEFGIGKPSPNIFRAAEKAVGHTPSELLFVGNSYRHDIEPAIACGWHTVWVNRATAVPPSSIETEKFPEEVPEGSPHPDAIISELSELLGLLSISSETSVN